MELMCDRVGVIVNGELCSMQSIEELVATAAPDRVQFVLSVNDAHRAAELISSLEGVTGEVLGECGILITLPEAGAKALLGEVNRTLITGGVSLYTVTPREQRRLEDVFIELTGTGGVSHV